MHLLFWPSFFLVGVLSLIGAVARGHTTSDGRDLSVVNFSARHQLTGLDPPNLAPLLEDNAIVVGDSPKLMQVAAILTYIQREFGKNDKSHTVATNAVAAARAKIDSATLTY